MDLKKFLEQITNINQNQNEEEYIPSPLALPGTPTMQQALPNLDTLPAEDVKLPPSPPKVKQPALSPKPMLDETLQQANIAIPEQQPPAQPLIDIDAYEKAVKEMADRKEQLAQKEALLNVVKGIAGIFGQVSPDQLKHIEISNLQQELTELPVKTLELSDKGRLLRTKMQNELVKNDPKSELSKIYRDNFKQVAKNLGLTNLSYALEKNNLSAQQVEDMVGQLNLNNLFNTKLANDARLETMIRRMELAGAQQHQKQEDKEEAEKIKMEERLRQSINRREDLGLSREVVKQARSLKMSVNDILNDMQQGKKLDVSGKSAAALFEAMKIIQQDKSVVREGEYKNILGAFGTLENFERQLRQNILKQGALSPNMIKALDSLADLYRKKHEQFIYEKIKPDFYKTEKHQLDKNIVFDQDLQEIYQKRKIMDELKGKVKIENGKIVIEK